MLKHKKLKDVWDNNSKRVIATYVKPTKKQIEKSRDFIYGWAMQINRKNSKRLLDVGCGIGQYVTGLRLLGFKAEGLDISPLSVKIGRKRGERITLGDVRNMPFTDEEFDLVIAGGSIEHFHETEKAIKEINRVLKINGVFLFNVPYKYTIYVLTKVIQQLFGVWQSGYEKSFSLSRLKILLKDSGFEIAEVKKTGIAQGARYPRLSNLLGKIDKVCLSLGFGGHHIWIKAVKVSQNKTK